MDSEKIRHEADSAGFDSRERRIRSDVGFGGEVSSMAAGVPEVLAVTDGPVSALFSGGRVPLGGLDVDFVEFAGAGYRGPAMERRLQPGGAEGVDEVVEADCKVRLRQDAVMKEVRDGSA